MIGFKKSHRIPPNRRDGLRFLSDLGACEIEADIDQKFLALKNGFRFKRREVTANTGELCGIIETPYFRYRLRLDFHPDDFGKVVWLRIVDEIAELAQITNPVFLEVFGRQFHSLELASSQPFPLEEIVDRIEDLESDSISVSYDKDLTWCEIGFSSGKIPIRLAGNRLQISSPLRDVTPGELLELLSEIQSQVLELFDADIGLPKLG
jgi:hypothetical protein